MRAWNANRRRSMWCGATLCVAGFIAVQGCATVKPMFSSPNAESFSECSSPTHVQPPPYGANPKVDNVAEPRVKVDPEYPSVAREARVEGTVMVTTLVCEHGHAVRTRISKSIPMLDAAAIAAVEKWEFAPAMTPGRPVPYWLDIPVNFTLH